MQFSERYGYKPVRELIQKDEIDDELKNTLWSIFHTFIWNLVRHSGTYSYTKNSNVYDLIYIYWLKIFKKPTDTIP